jgi:hypothetical protein
MRSNLRAATKGLLGEKVLGGIDYFRFPERRQMLGAAFNGQRFRQRLFQDLIQKSQPASIIETGTFRGASTEFMSKTGLPIFSIERNPRYYGFCRARLWGHRNVTLWCGDSRSGLRALQIGPLRNLSNRPVFVYLDAHWNDDLPLAEELEIVFSGWPSAIAMVDDFQVHDDVGYGYDNYGPNKALTSAYIARAAEKHDLRSFYPSTPSQMESGARRGCVVVAKNSVHGTSLLSMSLLRPDIREGRPVSRS